MHLCRQLNSCSLRCSWSIACRRCFNYIIIINLTLSLTGEAKTTARRDERYLSFGFGAPYIRDFTVTLLLQLESAGAEVCDGLYEEYGELISICDAAEGNLCYKSYFMVRQTRNRSSWHLVAILGATILIPCHAVKSLQLIWCTGSHTAWPHDRITG